jgi:hypothetical protein
MIGKTLKLVRGGKILLFISFHSHLFSFVDLMTGDNIKQKFLMNIATVRGKD